jgi:hypothetical protein
LRSTLYLLCTMPTCFGHILYTIKEISRTFWHFVPPQETQAAKFLGFLISDIIKLSARSELRPFDSGGTNLGTKQMTGRWACCWKFLWFESHVSYHFQVKLIKYSWYSRQNLLPLLPNFNPSYQFAVKNLSSVILFRMNIPWQFSWITDFDPYFVILRFFTLHYFFFCFRACQLDCYNSTKFR